MVLPRSSLALWLAGPALIACAGVAFVAPTRRAGEATRPQQEAAAPVPAAPTAECELCMEQGQREYLWDIEHHGNVLVRYGFRPLADALSRADRQAVAGL